MRVLTLRPGHAHDVCHSGKDVENRAWRYRPGVEDGELIAIHAGGARTREERENYVCGAIVAVAMVRTPIRNSRSRWAIAGCWHIPLCAVEVLRRPIPCRGQLGLWRTNLI
jgi:hypothetical protein